jgi:hypothetical protein
MIGIRYVVCLSLSLLISLICLQPAASICARCVGHVFVSANMAAIVGKSSVFNSSEAAYLISAFNASHDSTHSFGLYRRCLKSKSDCSTWPTFDWPFPANVGLIPRTLRGRLDTFVKSRSVRPVVYYDGWARRYPPRSSGLVTHFDDAWDELSVVVQLTAGAFLSVCSRRRGPFGRVGDLCPQKSHFEPIHLGAGEAIVYKGRDHAHGCRGLYVEEERWQMTLFYTLPRYLGVVDYCKEGGKACAEDLRQEDLPRLERRAAKTKAKRMAKRGSAVASAAHGRVRRDRAFSQAHTLTFQQPARAHVGY